MWGMVISVISGILMSVQGVFNSEVTKQTGIWIAAAFVQITAFVVCIVAWFVTGRESSFLAVVSTRPVYLLSGGIIGAFITYTVIIGMNTLGPAQSVLFIITAQIISAYLIELFGMFGVEKSPFQWTKLIGALIMVIGILVFKWKDLKI
ncbi:MAG: DMT family transporter [Lachnospiraceae bacterium]